MLFPALRIYTDRRLLVILALGFSGGLPLALTASTLFAWLAEVGIDKTTIGIFAGIALPYSIKFLWSPIMDGAPFPLLTRLMGRRRGWMLATQLALTVSIAAFALGNPQLHAWWFGLIALCVAFFSASQDIVIDAYRVETIPQEEQGGAAAMYTLGYRIAMLVSGAGALFLSDHISWGMTYVIMAGFMAVGIVTTLLMPEPEVSRTIQQNHSFQEWVQQSVVAPFADFMTRAGWLHILAFVVLFKLADAYLGVMFNPFLLDIGFTKSQIAAIVKVYGLAATIGGTFIGGAMVARYGMYKTLMATSICHILTNLLLVHQANLGADQHFLALCVVSENLTAGMGSAAFVAYLSSLCRLNYTATQYALLSSLAAVARTLISTASGSTAESLGWQNFFLFSSLLAIPSLILLWYIHKRWGVDNIR